MSQNREYIIEEAIYQAPHLLPSIWRRLYGAANRFYFPCMGAIEILAGITTILEKSLPKAKEQIDWLIKNGWEGLSLYADYGTAGHTALSDFNMGNDWSLNIPKKEWISKIENMIIAWQNTISKYEIVEYLLIETPVKGKIKGCKYITTVDFCAKVRVPYIVKKERTVETGEFYQKDTKDNKKGDPKTRIEKYPEIEYKTEIWVIDFKTNYDGKESKDYYDSHLYQLIAQKRAIKQQYGIDVTRIFNWSEKAFMIDNDTNTYQLVEWVVEGKERVGEWHHKGFKANEFRILDNHMETAMLKGYNLPSGKIKSTVYARDEHNRLCVNQSIVSYNEWVANYRQEAAEKGYHYKEQADSTETHDLVFITATYPEYVTMLAEKYDEEWILGGYVRDMSEGLLLSLVGEAEEDGADVMLPFKANQASFLVYKKRKYEINELTIK